MKNTFLASGIILGVIAVLGIGGYLSIQHSLKEPEGITSLADDIAEQKEEPQVEEQNEDAKFDGGEANIEEAQVQEYLHHMAHQKVEAEKKWGAVKMTPENIESLLAVVKANEDKYEYGDYYRTVLEKWQAEDFENAVDVHNFIWQLQGGTIGRATGLLDEAEEQAYIEEHFTEQ